ncbi:hypothetical protein JCGZ_26461 [Jatropha curcas]|uniref:Phytosulfokine n=1 Tax=Jatropha curcas TaxID=180498 RepID=A0A067JPD9_JATCU|nr:phytosulfokines [Jatropha curcas]KDP24683.1 hypothetical protein JCGZ_26461 [Jatropha curcas]
MSKLGIFLVLALVLILGVSDAVPLNPASNGDSLDVELDKIKVDESCEGIEEEECLIRRTLSADLDYIYTQSPNKPPNKP